MKGQKQIEKLGVKLERLQIEYVPINSIKPNEYNPNRQSDQEFELLTKSMEEDGFTQPVVVMKSSRVIVDGEHRWRAAQYLKFTEIPVVFVDMTEAQRRISTLRHNRARGTEDMQLTAEVLRDLEKLGAMEWAKDSLMVSNDEVERMLKDIPPPEEFGKDHEFNEAWIPAKTGEEGLMGDRPDNLETASTEEARRVSFLRQDKLKEAKTQEEKDMVLKTNRIFSLTLGFSEEEFKLVKEVLGSSPAVTLVKLCQEYTSQLNAKT